MCLVGVLATLNGLRTGNAVQVHGVVHDTIDFVEGILTTEMNAATDNPMVFTGSAFPPLSTPLRIVMRVAGGLGV